MSTRRITDSARKRKSKKQLAEEEFEIEELHALSRAVRERAIEEMTTLTALIDASLRVARLFGKDRLRDYVTAEGTQRLVDDLKSAMDRAEDVIPVNKYFTLHSRSRR